MDTPSLPVGPRHGAGAPSSASVEEGPPAPAGAPVAGAENGRSMPADEPEEDSWGARNPDNTSLVRTVIKNLRRKLGEDPKAPAWIFNQRGVGYRMARPGKP